MLKRWTALPQGIRWLAGGIAAVVLGLALAWALFVPGADWLAHHDVGSAKGPLLQTARDAARGRLVTFGAGLFAAGALIFTALNFNLLRRNSERADQWQRRSYELTEQGQVTDRYTKAIEQLGSEKLDVRIGGIYALERVARDSARDHPTVMEVLTAFIREHSHDQGPQPESNIGEPQRSALPDIQAAVTVVKQRDQQHDIRPINLALANLARATLVDARLAGAVLFAAYLGGADLAGADLAGATLGGATLNYARLTGANLADADLIFADLTNTNFTGATLTGAHLGHANLNAAILTGADLTGATLTDADLAVADFTDADLTRADLARADLTNTNFTNARWSEDAPVPEGWKRGANSGRLERAGPGSGPAEAN